MTSLLRLGLLSLLLLTGLSYGQDRAQKQATVSVEKLIRLLATTDDTNLQLDILRGLSSAFQSERSRPMPGPWPRAEEALVVSPIPQIRTLSEGLAMKFGSAKARDRSKKAVSDVNTPAEERKVRLRALLDVADPNLASLLETLLGDQSLRGEALKALGRYNSESTPSKILAVYPGLTSTEKRDALLTLASRKTWGLKLLEGVGLGLVGRGDLTAGILRQLRNHKSQAVDDAITEHWGEFNESTADKAQLIAKYRNIYRSGGSTPGNGSRGRSVYARTCQQCHRLYEVGGNVGPDLTGSNRRDLDYLLQNIVDPNSVIPNEYRSTTIELKDGRILTGIVKSESANAVQLMTQTETLSVQREDIDILERDRLSMMPEGLLAPLKEQEIRDLIYYLRGSAQFPLLATTATADMFFNGHDLTNWEGDSELWQVEGGDIVGRTETGLKSNAFLLSQMVADDFTFTCQVKLTPNAENSGIQFRSQPEAVGSVKGYQADIGQGWWGKLYEEHGRALLWDKSGESHVKIEEWNHYKIEAIEHRIRTYINGHLCVDLEDKEGALRGHIAFQLHSGGPMEVRFRNPSLKPIN